ncbi:dihydrofolate reductase family protein [Streptomyces litchfieldiae]|uniref:Dihydrofolate reductase family protein n=1 Tax=Streptomyces litchfieldiae TaxID=3075543 RepID=A0ABU2MT18_9ACTN|nr:dihydrofolate reductase family protein [Streptomyces sp. DSM 44938]MDT0344782.1 dihydrofolate reductase family protein [Streptomyces sp. DSM 44938]
MSRDPAPQRPHQQVFAFLFCSLDGYHEGPGGELGWGVYDEEFFEWNLRQTREVGALLLGRRTYEHFAEVWPSADAAQRLPDIAAFMNAVPKTVVTSSGSVTPWEGTRVTDGSDLDAEVVRLRGESAGDVAVFGSSGLTVSLLERGLVDELRILVHPVLLGSGRSLFAGLKDRVDLTARAVTVFRSGNVLLRYRPPGRAGSRRG